jgi:hypothetical protein
MDTLIMSSILNGLATGFAEGTKIREDKIVKKRELDIKEKSQMQEDELQKLRTFSSIYDIETKRQALQMKDEESKANIQLQLEKLAEEQDKNAGDFALGMSRVTNEKDRTTKLEEYNNKRLALSEKLAYLKNVARAGGKAKAPEELELIRQQAEDLKTKNLPRNTLTNFHLTKSKIRDLELQIADPKTDSVDKQLLKEDLDREVRKQRDNLDILKGYGNELSVGIKVKKMEGRNATEQKILEEQEKGKVTREGDVLKQEGEMAKLEETQKGAKELKAIDTLANVASAKIAHERDLEKLVKQGDIAGAAEVSKQFFEKNKYDANNVVDLYKQARQLKFDYTKLSHEKTAGTSKELMKKLEDSRSELIKKTEPKSEQILHAKAASGILNNYDKLNPAEKAYIAPQLRRHIARMTEKGVLATYDVKTQAAAADYIRWFKDFVKEGTTGEYRAEKVSALKKQVDLFLGVISKDKSGTEDQAATAFARINRSLVQGYGSNEKEIVGHIKKMWALDLDAPGATRTEMIPLGSIVPGADGKMYKKVKIGGKIKFQPVKQGK